MYKIEFLETNKEKIYNGEQSIGYLVNYVMNIQKVMEDKLRVNTTDLICSGCSPFPFPHICENNPEEVIFLMKTNMRTWGKGYDDVMRHRIISVPAHEYVCPVDLYLLGRRIVDFYSRKGFISCYGVHRNTYEFHVHIAVNTISYVNGNKMSISYEFNHIYGIVNDWQKNLNDKLSDYKRKERYENILFGDDCVPLHMKGLGAIDQIKANKEYNKQKKMS